VIDDTAEKTGQGENKIDKVSPESFRGPRETRMYAQLRVKRFSMFGTALCLAACASAQTADLPPQSPAAISPISSHVVLEKLPPSAPTITYDNGVLTISAYNSTLSDILQGIRNQTGADVDIPPQPEERVVTHLGPGSARDVVRSLLSGSRFNYILVGSNADPNTLTRILLFPRPIAEKIPERPLVNASPVQQARSLASESDNVNVMEGVQEEDKPQEPELPVRAEQRILQQRRQMIMEAFQQDQQPASR
jgi:hypothetical protein